MIDDDRITRIARALCRSARIDPDSIVAADHEVLKVEPVAFDPHEASVPAWTRYRAAALSFVHSHGERVVAQL